MIASCDRLIAAPVDVVWQLVTTPGGLNQWMSVQATIDLRVGGTIRSVHDNGWIVAGTIREVRAMRRLSFTFGWEQGGFAVPLESTVVTIELTPRGAATEVAVRHGDLTTEMAGQHTEGWNMFVDRLARRAEQLIPVTRERGADQ